jgi:hypothetical protein
MLLLRVEISCLINLRRVTPIRCHLVLQYEQALISCIIEVMVVIVMVS